MPDQFRARALAASCVDPTSIFDDEFDEVDVCLVAQIMEIDHKHRLAMAKITGFELKRQGDRQYLARCREARKKITANTDQKKQEALAAWWPSFGRPEIQSTTH